MAEITTLRKCLFGDITAEYLIDEMTRAVSLRLVPAAMQEQLAQHRETFTVPAPAWRLEPLVQFKLQGDSTSSYAQGLTLRNSATLAGLRLEGQQVIAALDTTTVVTRLVSERGYAVEHRLIWRAGDRALTVRTTFINQSEQALTLEMLASFSLSGISPFAADDAPGRLYVHRFRSAWSAEGRHECRLAEDAGLEPSWAHHGVRVERYAKA